MAAEVGAEAGSCEVGAIEAGIGAGLVVCDADIYSKGEHEVPPPQAQDVCDADINSEGEHEASPPRAPDTAQGDTGLGPADSA